MSGKLVEIGVKKTIEKINKEKKLHLDFDIRNPSEVRIEPDIILVEEKKIKREPNVFLEVKRVSETDRWSGLTLEQQASMIEGSKGKKMYIISASLNCDELKDNNPKSGDILGMYLKQITNSKEFKNFANLNLYTKLEYVLSMEDLEEFGTKFPKNKLFYETSIFNEVNGIINSNGSLRKGINIKTTYSNFDSQLTILTKEKIKDKEYGTFKIKGKSFSILEKKNPKSTIQYIQCNSNVIISNNVFGKFHLDNGKIYQFNLLTIGRDPILKRDNIFISKRRINELINEKKIEKPEVELKKISKTI